MQVGKFVRLPKEVAKAIENLSKLSGISQSALIRDCVMAQIASRQLQRRLKHRKFMELDCWEDAQELASTSYISDIKT